MDKFDKLKRFLGVKQYSAYINEHFDNSNIKSSLYVSSVVIILELWMILSTLLTQLDKRSKQWLIIHFFCYIALLFAALLLFLYSYFHLKKLAKNRTAWRSIRLFFSLVSMCFGIYISYLDYLKGEQFITLITMTIFVLCFIVWRPIDSLLILSISYGFFFYICNKRIPATYATKVNLIIVFISILMSAVNAFARKIKEAEKEEKLEKAHDILLKLSISDEVTGIANMNYFRGQALDLMNRKETDVSKFIYLFFDIENFKILNRKYGFWEGNNFLRRFADILNEEFDGSIIAHFSNDNFIVLTEDKGIKDKILIVCQKMQQNEYDLKLGLKVGAYRPPNKECLPLLACDHARYACNSIKKHYNITYCEYTRSMALEFQKKQYILNNFDNAIEKEYIKVYYQPVINAATGNICGLEALARWDDPQYGLLPPADFITTLEEYYQIHRLDMFVVNQVGKYLQKEEAEGHKLLPVSLNFSRLDFDSLNLAEEVENCLQKYNIDKKYIHIEITETTLSEDDERLKDALKRFRAYGYALWLDDFGSGYSGLNVLKEYDFDMMKIDMKFLTNFSTNSKARQILKNVINLAKELGMNTLCEGVETEEAYHFLKENGCEQIQGYLFGKPMTKEALKEKLSNGFYKVD